MKTVKVTMEMTQSGAERFVRFVAQDCSDLVPYHPYVQIRRLAELLKVQLAEQEAEEKAEAEEQARKRLPSVREQRWGGDGE